MSAPRPEDELAALVADLGASIAWAARCGASVLPAEAVQLRPPEPPPPRRRAPAARQPPAPQARPQAPGGPAPWRGGGSPPAPPRHPAPRGAQPAADRGRRPTPGPEPRTRVPGPSPAPQGQLALGKWARFKGSGDAPAGAPPAGDPRLSQASDLRQIREVLGECQRCGLCRGRSRVVFGVGSPGARLMIIGEAPGFNEDRQGEPFVGKAGQMLDRMLVNVLGLQRQDVYITNVVKCRPPDNRNPQGEEIARCAPFLQAQLRVVDPDVVLILGSVATRTVLRTTSGVKRLRGQWQQVRWPGGSARAMATFHPAYLLRQPQDKRLTFQDLQEVKRALDAAG